MAKSERAPAQDRPVKPVRAWAVIGRKGLTALHVYITQAIATEARKSYTLWNNSAGVCQDSPIIRVLIRPAPKRVLMEQEYPTVDHLRSIRVGDAHVMCQKRVRIIVEEV